MSEDAKNICTVNVQSGISTASPQITQFSHNCSAVKFIVKRDLTGCAAVIIASAENEVFAVSEGEALTKSYDSEKNETTLMWYPGGEITASSGCVIYQLAAYSTDDEDKVIWYSKEGRLLVTDSIDTTNMSTQLIGSYPNLVMQILMRVQAVQNMVEALPSADLDYESQSSNPQSGIAVAKALASLVNSAPETLNTLDELASALGDDPNFATTIMTLLGGKADKSESAKLTEDIQRLDAEINTVNEGLGDMKTYIQDMDDDFDRLKICVGDIDADIESLKSMDKTVTGNIDNLNIGMQNTSDAIEENTAAIDAVNADIQRINSDIGNIDTALDGIITHANILIGGDSV